MNYMLEQKISKIIEFYLENQYNELKEHYSKLNEIERKEFNSIIKYNSLGYDLFEEDKEEIFELIAN